MVSIADSIALIKHATNEEDLALWLGDLKSEHRLANLVYHGVNIPGRETPLLCLTYEEAWVARYKSENYFEFDPIVERCSKTVLPMDWSEFRALTPATTRFFAEAEKYGVGSHGVSVPIRGPNGELGLFTITANLSDAEWTLFKQYKLPALFTLGHYFHDRMMFLTGYRDRCKRPLEEREKVTIELFAAGYTAKQISSLLKVSETTVRIRLNGVCEKLECINAVEAASKAILLGIIDVNRLSFASKRSLRFSIFGAMNVLASNWLSTFQLVSLA